ncbi:DUF3310 domain-containing protein [Acidaminococcus sp. LBK-2]|uniref:DUF3310 domain-containing protein n=1 Tax=Acidaminococcus sp. LBK-2 TaxID=3456956 RepID=UPI003FA49C72
MTSKETAQRCHKCDMAIPDGGQMLCMGVKPIALIDDVTDDDCPKHRVTPEAPADKKRPGRKPKTAKEPETKAALPDPRTDPDRSGQIRTDSDRFGQAQSDPKARPIAVYRPKAPLEFVELGIQMPAPEPKTAEADPVHHPGHYAWRGGLECIEIARELCQGSDGIAAYLIGCAVKYIYRYPRKNGLQDLDKAIECLTMLRAIEARKGGDTDAR